jgi:hypothetical protein
MPAAMRAVAAGWCLGSGPWFKPVRSIPVIPPIEFLPVRTSTTDHP